MNNELNNIIDKASIQFTDDDDTLFVRTKFNLNNKSNLGVILFLFASLFILIISILKGNDWIVISLGVLLGGFIFVFAILTVLKQLTDYTKVTANEIQFKNSLKMHTFPLHANMKIKMDAHSEYSKMKSRAESGSYYRIIEIYLKNNSTKYRIFDFQVPDEYAKEANALGKEIVNRIRNRIKAHNTI